MSVGRQPYVLDTSAVIALMEDERGADRVDALIRRERVLIPFVVGLEVYYIALQEQGQDVADHRYAAIAKGEAEMLWEMNEPVLLASARLKAAHRISLGDSIVAGYALHHNAVLVHKDPEFEPLADELRLEALPYKR